MKKILYILLLTTFGANAQSISNQVVSSYGLSAVNGTAQTDVTIGEPVTATVSDGNNTLTQGFHQTKLIITTISENEKTNNYQFYPNPVNEVLNFNFTNSNNEPVGLQLFDINGKILYNKQNITTNEQLSFSDKANGQYILKVIDKNNKEIKTVKIIKN
ncbi:MAG: T9SS type A sorting domain-containing protein [Flavobacteriales bacterium]|nr:MAG: T9SS type A sorting domain-containing protein [Flavobacteriales bacterium]MBE7443273.1 T9SS type A sorting domain-containing protein [Flavobacteriales bacterium]